MPINKLNMIRVFLLFSIVLIVPLFTMAMKKDHKNKSDNNVEQMGLIGKIVDLSSAGDCGCYYYTVDSEGNEQPGNLILYVENDGSKGLINYDGSTLTLIPNKPVKTLFEINNIGDKFTHHFSNNNLKVTVNYEVVELYRDEVSWAPVFKIILDTSKKGKQLSVVAKGGCGC